MVEPRWRRYLRPLRPNVDTDVDASLASIDDLRRQLHAGRGPDESSVRHVAMEFESRPVVLRCHDQRALGSLDVNRQPILQTRFSTLL
jgi:hypothetical protein